VRGPPRAAPRATQGGGRSCGGRRAAEGAGGRPGELARVHLGHEHALQQQRGRHGGHVHKHHCVHTAALHSKPQRPVPYVRPGAPPLLGPHLSPGPEEEGGAWEEAGVSGVIPVMGPRGAGRKRRAPVRSWQSRSTASAPPRGGTPRPR